MQTAEIAGAEWLTIREVAGEIARQLNTGVTFGSQTGSEALVDPELLLPDWQPEVSLSQGLAKVIEDARRFLDLGADRRQAAQK